MGDRATISRASSSMGFDRATSSIRIDRASPAWPSASSVTACTRTTRSNVATKNSRVTCDHAGASTIAQFLAPEWTAQPLTRDRATLQPDNVRNHPVRAERQPLPKICSRTRAHPLVIRRPPFRSERRTQTRPRDSKTTPTGGLSIR